MAAINLLNVAVKNNPAKFDDPYEFEITFDCLEALQHDVEWKLIYVGSAQSSEYDQELDNLLVGPVPQGISKFTFAAEHPSLSKIPASDILGVTVILLTGSYADREFVRIGYYVNNEYTDDTLNANPPSKPILEKIRRSILAEKPRVTRFAIKWDSEESAPPEFPPDQLEADLAADDEALYGAEEAEEAEALAEDEEDEEVEGESGDEEAKPEDAEMEVDGAEKANETEPESEDIENDSEEDDFDEDEEEVETDTAAPANDDDIVMGDDSHSTEAKSHGGHVQQDVMVH